MQHYTKKGKSYIFLFHGLNYMQLVIPIKPANGWGEKKLLNLKGSEGCWEKWAFLCQHGKKIRKHRGLMNLAIEQMRIHGELDHLTILCIAQFLLQNRVVGQGKVHLWYVNLWHSRQIGSQGLGTPMSNARVPASLYIRDPCGSYSSLNRPCHSMSKVYFPLLPYLPTWWRVSN